MGDCEPGLVAPCSSPTAGQRRPLAALGVVMASLLVACAQQQGALIEEWHASAEVRRVVVLPANSDSTPPNYLAAATERVTDAVAERVEATNRSAIVPQVSATVETAEKIARELALDTYDRDAVRPLLARRLAERHDADLVLIPAVVVRDAKVDGPFLVWDGARERYRTGMMTPGYQLVELRGEEAAISVRVVAFDRAGERVRDAYGGLQAAYSMILRGDRYEIRHRKNLLDDPAVIAAGVERALGELLGAAVVPIAAPDATSAREGPWANRWVRARLGGLTFVTNANDTVAAALVRDSIRFLAVAEGITGLRLDPDVEIEVVAFRRAREFHRYHGDALLGVASASGNTTRVAIHTEEARFRVPTLYHELVHILLLHQPERTYPAWYHEGLAELLGAVTIQGDVASVNPRPAHRVDAIARLEPIPLASLLGRRSFVHLTPVEAEAYYSDAWAFVSFLHSSTLHGRADPRTRVNELIDRTTAGEAWESAFRAVLSRDVDDLDQEYRAFRRSLAEGSSQAFERHEARPTVASVEFEAMEPVEVDITLGEYCLALDPGTVEMARRHFRLALRREPENSRSAAGLVQALVRSGNIERAAREFERYARSKRGNTRIAIAGAELLFAGYAAGAIGPETIAGYDPLPDARARLRRAVAEDPRYFDAWRLIGRSYLVDPGTAPEPGIEAFRRAVALAPAELGVRLDLAVLLARAGESEAARRQLERVLASHQQELVDEATRRLDELGDPESALQPE